MKFLLIVILVLSGCKQLMSDEEKISIAKRACNVVMSTRKFESARRIQLIDEAREKIGKDPYPSVAVPYLDWALKGGCLGRILDKKDIGVKHHHLLD